MTTSRPHLARTLALSALLTSVPLFGASYANASVPATPNCRAAQLTLTRGSHHVVGHVTYTALVVTNTATTCALWGVPAIQPVGAKHRPVGPLARSLSMGEMPVRHVIARGVSVSASFGVTNTTSVPASTCHAARSKGIVVALGSFFSGRFLPMPLSVCTASASTTTRLLAPGTKG